MAGGHQVFGQGESEASNTHPVQVSSLCGYVMINDRPCKILDMSTSKTGKHGHAKVHMVARHIFTGRKVEFIGPARDTIEVPVVKKRQYMLVSMDSEGFFSLLGMETYMLRLDMRTC